MISLAQLKQRKLVQWGLAYLASAWLILQVAGLLSAAYAWPALVLRALPIALFVGFFAALIVAWYHSEKGAQRVSSIEIAILTMLLVIAGVGVSWTWGGSTAPQPTQGFASAATDRVAEQGSIAILPFVNMSSDPEQEYFSDGLTEELLNVLAQIPELRVAARTSAFAFKGKDVGIDSIARALNVAHVLEGSVRKSGDRVRITAQLIDARDGFHLWSEAYDRDLRDVFAVQDEISRAVAGQLRITLAEDAPLARQETDNPEAHTLLLRGIAAHRTSTRESQMEAERLFREAILLDPGYAPAHARLANTLMVRAYTRHIPKEAGYAEAAAVAERAIALDPRISEAHTVLGRIADSHDWDFAVAEEHFRRAIEAKPGDGRTRTLRAWLLMRMGKRDEALREARRAVEIDPLSMAAYNNLGVLYSYAGDPGRARDALMSALAFAPDAATVVSNLALTYSDMGRHAEAIRTAERAASLDPEDVFTIATVGTVYGRAGRRTEAERALADLIGREGASPYLVAGIHAGLGDTERAITLLERAVEERDDLVTDLGMDPVFKQLHGDPRVQRLLRRMGLA